MFQPTGIIKMTNVAFIKYKINNTKFEIACYKNKAINWRNGVEKDINEVLQSEEIYTNASHGTIAKKRDLEQLFGQMSKMDIIKTILEKGELQVSEKEREVQLTSLQNDIINIITEKCVHPDSQRKFSVNQIQQAIKSIGFQVKPDQPAKRQALDCMRLLLKKFYMQRAEMLISVNIPTSEKARLMKSFEEMEISSSSVQKTVLKDEGKRTEIVVNIEPSKFRPITQVAKEELADCIIEVISNTVTNSQVHGIESAGTANLQIRDDWKDDNEEDVKNKKSSKTSTNPSKPKDEEVAKETKKPKKTEKEEDSDDDIPSSAADETNAKKKKKNKKKNPQLDERMQLEKEKEFQLEQLRLEELNKAKQKRIADEQEKVGKTEKQTEDLDAANAGKKKCPQCKEAYFDTVQEFRNHYKTDWHVLNVKRKQKGEPILSEIEYKVHHLDINFV